MDEKSFEVAESSFDLLGFIAYPLQNNIHRLPKEEFLNCLFGLLKKKLLSKDMAKETFRDWLLEGFGEELCDSFMFPYNFKVWGYPASEMNVEWMGERVATVDVDSIVRNAVEDKDSIGWGPNSTFRFPLHGGTGQIWKNTAERIGHDKFQLNTRVTSVDLANKKITTASGEEIVYDRLISTVALNCLCQMIGGEFSVFQDKFKFSSTHVVGIGLEGAVPEHLATKCWLYFPEDNCPFCIVDSLSC